MVEKVYEKKNLFDYRWVLDFFSKKYCEFFLKNDYLVFGDNNKKKLQSLRSLKKIILKILKL